MSKKYASWVTLRSLGSIRRVEAKLEGCSIHSAYLKLQFLRSISKFGKLMRNHKAPTTIIWFESKNNFIFLSHHDSDFFHSHNEMVHFFTISSVCSHANQDTQKQHSCYLDFCGCCRRKRCLDACLVPVFCFFCCLSQFVAVCFSHDFLTVKQNQKMRYSRSMMARAS